LKNTLVIVSDFYVAKYRDGEEHARKVAARSIAMPCASFRCIFPESMLDLVPAKGYAIENIGRAYAEQGSDEVAYIVSSVTR